MINFNKNELCIVINTNNSTNFFINKKNIILYDLNKKNYTFK